MKRIAICIPTYNNVPSTFFVWFMEALEHWNKIYEIKVFTISTQPVDYARNKLIDLVLSSGKFDYVMFIDSDTYFNPDLLDRLIKDEKDIVSGLYFSRIKPHNPIAFKYNEGKFEIFKEFDLNKLLEVDSIGLGCCLIKTEVFDKISKPYFKYDVKYEGNILKYTSEDTYFCNKLKEVSFKIFLDTGVICRHYGADIGIENYNNHKYMIL